MELVYRFKETVPSTSYPRIFALKKTQGDQEHLAFLRASGTGVLYFEIKRVNPAS
jgi:hypothetical protein